MTIGLIALGGLGTRLRPLTYHKPKSLVFFAEKTILDYIIEEYQKLGIKKFILIINYLGDLIRKHILLKYSNQGLKFEFIIQEKPLGSAHAVFLAEKKVNEPLLIAWGDAIYLLNKEIINNDYDGVFGVKEVEDPRAYGVIHKKMI